MIKIRRVIHTKRLLSLVLCLVLLVSVFPYGTLATTTDEGQPAEENQTEAQVQAAGDESEEEQETSENQIEAAEGNFPINVVIHIVNENGDDLLGCTYTVFKGNSVADTKTDANVTETVSIPGPGTWTVNIYEAPSGYKSSASQKFDVDENGNVTMKGDPVSEIKVEVPFFAEYEVSIRLVDKNDTSKDLNGGKLQIFDADGNQKGVALEPKGTTMKVKLEPGDYILKQLSAPDCYFIGDNVAFQVEKPEPGEAGEPAVVLMEDDSTKVEINKVDPEGKRLNGAILYLFGPYKDKSAAQEAVDENKLLTSIADWTSDSSRGKRFDGELLADQYYVVDEGNPPTYHVNSGPFIFKVASTADVQAINLVNERDMTRTWVELRKQDSITGELLKGATIEITGPGLEEAIIWDTDKDNPLTLTGKLEAGEEYTLHETKTPPNYVAPTNDYKFTVQDPGDTQVVILNNVADPDLPRVQVWARDLYSGAAIGGADLEIREADTNSKVAVWTSQDDAGHMVIGGMALGKTYILKAVNAPAGFSKLMDEMTFTVRADSKVQMLTMYYYPGRTSMEITKTVTGTKGDRTYDFPFTFTFSLPGIKNPDPVDYTIVRGGKQIKEGNLTSGGTVRLRHGDKLVIKNLIAGMDYSIKEWENDYYKVTVRDEYDYEFDVEDSTIEEKVRPHHVNEVNFTNNKGPIPAAGEENHMGLGLGMMLLGILGCCVLVGAYVLNEKKRML